MPINKTTMSRTCVGPRIGRFLNAGAIACALAAAVAPVLASGGPVVHVSGGDVRGVADGRVDKFLGIPYAAPPVGERRWRSPQAAENWSGTRDATGYGSGCPQPATQFGVASESEDCLYLNVFTPAGVRAGSRPVLVWIHGGGLSLGESQDYDPTQFAADGTVVVTINYRLGALGFLAHPALVNRERGPSGNYGWMDQQQALRWVQRNIAKFGGDPRNVTIAGQSAGGLSVLAQLASPGARGLFDRAIVQSGDFALSQTSLADAERAGETFAQKVGCGDQTAACLRALPTSELLENQDFAYIPGIVDGEVLKQSIDVAFETGAFSRIPIINGTVRDEERLFVSLGANVTDGKLLPIQGAAITAANYRELIASNLEVSSDVAAAIDAHYPLGSFSAPSIAFSALQTDRNFACPANRMNRMTAKFVPTFVYEFNDENAPERFLPPGFPYGAAHQSELQYLFGLPTAQFSIPLSEEQMQLATDMRRYWSNFAQVGMPSVGGKGQWPRFESEKPRVLSLTTPMSSVEGDFSERHQCRFWAQVESTAHGRN